MIFLPIVILKMLMLRGQGDYNSVILKGKVFICKMIILRLEMSVNNDRQV